MASAQIVFRQNGDNPGLTPGSRDDLVLNSAVTVLNSPVGNINAIQWFWEILDRPSGSTAIFTSGGGLTSTFSTDTFTPDVVGTYLIRLTVNNSVALVDHKGAAVKTAKLHFRIPAADETLEFDLNRGWATGVNEALSVLDDGYNAASTLQDILNASPTTSVTLHNSGGGLFIRDASPALGTDIFRVASNDGLTKYLGVSTISIDAATHPIINVVDPTNAQDAATKNYVDTHVSTSTLQTTYNASSPPKIFVNSSQGAIQIHDASPSIAANLFEVDGYGNTPKYLAVNPSTGVSIGTTLDVTGLITMESGFTSSNDGYIAGSLSIVSNNPFTLTVTGPASFSSSLTTTGFTTMTGGFTSGANSSVTGQLTISSLHDTGLATVGSTLAVTGVATFTSGFVANQDSYMGTGPNTNLIHNLADPVVAQDAATKSYVDAAVGGPAAATLQIPYNNYVPNPAVISLHSSPGSLIIEDDSPSLATDLFIVRANGSGGTKLFRVHPSTGVNLDTTFNVNNNRQSTFDGYVQMNKNLSVGFGTTIGLGLTVGLGATVGLGLTVSSGGASIHGNSTFDGFTVRAAQTIDMGANRVTNCADPTANQDAATKAYVDSSATGSVLDVTWDQVYSNSSADSEVLQLNNVLNGVAIHDGSPAITGNLIEVDSYGGGTKYFRVDTTGATATNLTATGIVSGNSGTFTTSLAAATTTASTSASIFTGDNQITITGTSTKIGQNALATNQLVIWGSGGIDMKNNGIIDLANPTNSQDAATKAYVDSAVAGGAATIDFQFVYNTSNPASFFLNSTNGPFQVIDNTVSIATNLFEVDAYGTNGTNGTKYFRVHPTTGVFTSGKFQAGDVATFSAGFTSSANSSVSGTLTVSGLTDTGNATVSGTLGVTLGSTFTGGFSSGANSSVTGTFSVTGLTTMTGGFFSNAQGDMDGYKIVNLADPTANQDAATKFYVDAQVGGSLAIGNAVGSGTSGSVLFIDSSVHLAQDNADFFWDNTNKRLGIGTSAPTAQLHNHQLAKTTGSPVAFQVTGGAHTTLTAGTEIYDGYFKLDRTVQFNSGALSTQRAVYITAPTYAFTASSTITNAATVAIANAPQVGTNASITNAYALWVQAGVANFASHIMVDGYTIDISAGATTNQVLTYNGTSFVALSISGAGGVTGSGTTNTITKWSGSSSLTNAGLTDDGTTVSTAEKLALTTTTFNQTSGGVSRISSASTFSPGSGSGSFASLQLNPTVSGTSTGTATGLAVASVTNSLTGGTTNLIDLGTTTTDYFTGYTQRFAINTSGSMTQTQAVITSGSPNLFKLIGGAHTTLTASTEAIDGYVELDRTVQFAGNSSPGAANITTQRAMYISPPTYAFSNTGNQTITNAATLAIGGAPSAGTHAIITNAYSIWAQAGLAAFDSHIKVDGYTIDISGGATTNQTLVYNGTKFVPSSVTAGSVFSSGQLLINTITMASRVSLNSSTFYVAGAHSINAGNYTLSGCTLSATFTVTAAVSVGTLTGTVKLTNLTDNVDVGSSTLTFTSTTPTTTSGTLTIGTGSGNLINNASKLYEVQIKISDATQVGNTIELYSAMLVLTNTVN